MRTSINYEDLEVGEELPQFTKGPLTVVHLMRWSAAVENWHRIHYDRKFAIEHDKLPDILINGSLKQQFIVQFLRQWVGRDGWVWKVSYQFRAMNMVDETLRIWGRITAKRKLSDFGLVHLDIGIVNDQDIESTPGKAVVAVPYRDGVAVPYPFVPPDRAAMGSDVQASG